MQILPLVAVEFRFGEGVGCSMEIIFDLFVVGATRQRIKISSILFYLLVCY
jgi:hypothetical protein